MARLRLRRRLKSLTRLFPQYKRHRPTFLTFHGHETWCGWATVLRVPRCKVVPKFVKLDRNEMPGCDEIR
jgi:hypothetical protein